MFVSFVPHAYEFHMRSRFNAHTCSQHIYGYLWRWFNAYLLDMHVIFLGHSVASKIHHRINCLRFISKIIYCIRFKVNCFISLRQEINSLMSTISDYKEVMGKFFNRSCQFVFEKKRQNHIKSFIIIFLWTLLLAIVICLYNFQHLVTDNFLDTDRS